MWRVMDDPDTAAVLGEVDRFAARTVAAALPPAGLPVSAAALGGVLDAARALGLVPACEQPPGLAVWDDADAAQGPRRSVRILARLAREHAGVALALHREALGAWLARELCIAPGRVVGTVQGRFGLARTSLARHLAGAPLEDPDRALLDDVFGEGPRLSTAHGDFAALLAPRWHGDELGWVCAARDDLDAAEQPHTHGFEELSTLAFRARGRPIVGGDGRTRMVRALVIDGLGLLAIARGAAERAVTAAAAYAATRRQGGVLIERHAAVQQLLASGRSALHVVDAMLAGAAAGPAGAMTLGPTLAARAEGHVLLARAANDALQVLGGTGYMREAGLEKALRDVNHLRVVSGSPPELALFLDTWERLHA